MGKHHLFQNSVL